MSFDVDIWLDTTIEKLQEKFSQNLLFVGLQGSYNRGEATDFSDIDLIVILENLTFEDLKRYRLIIDSLPHKEKACGFISGKNELQKWSKADMFQFYYDTKSLYGKLEDKFGDNGVVTVVIGRVEAELLHMELWLMSCRVLKRDMEFAMMDEVIEKCLERGIKAIRGYYYPTAKNAMVKNFYELQGFTKISEDEAGNAVWEYQIPDEYVKKNNVIKVID